MILTLVAVYMPHSSYADHFIQAMYDQLEPIILEARKRNHVILIAGDWNAEAPSSTTPGLDGSVGRFANSQGNVRGEWLKQWAETSGFVLANSIFKKRWGHTWTHEQRGRKRQIDYLL
eukprot:9097762-Karenia_brevis.AAC.1